MAAASAMARKIEKTYLDKNLSKAKLGGLWSSKRK